MTIAQYLRQGDLVLQRVPDASTDAPARPLTLAIGEESGHSHALTARLVSGGLGEGVIVLDAPADLRVDGQPWRHTAITVPPGTYRYWVQRELSEGDEVRRVQD